MSIITELNTFNAVPSYAKILKNFPRVAVANKVGITSTYLCNILCGSKEPSKNLDLKLQELADSIATERGVMV
ncbi:hypothetical protein [Desulfobacula sp.]|uniref:hypothetical protein n=1 Tax=Desulfobacula sp. TaxID=2593537 RepID=UPI00263A330D|nr:hypothetical protein [Desulfobacula sp.]